MTDPKAPLPDEVENALGKLSSGYDGRHGAYEPTASVYAIRSHIAAQDEKIAVYENLLEIETATDGNGTGRAKP